MRLIPALMQTEGYFDMLPRLAQKLKDNLREGMRKYQQKMLAPSIKIRNSLYKECLSGVSVWTSENVEESSTRHSSLLFSFHIL